MSPVIATIKNHDALPPQLEMVFPEFITCESFDKSSERPNGGALSDYLINNFVSTYYSSSSYNGDKDTRRIHTSPND